MLWDPPERLPTLKAAFPVLSSVAVPIGFRPSEIVTMPVGIPLPPPAATTDTLNTTAWPNELGFGVAETVVALGLLLMVCGPVPVDGRKLLSPA